MKIVVYPKFLLWFMLGWILFLLLGCAPSRQAEYVECIERNGEGSIRYCQYKVYGRQVHRPIKWR